MRQFGKEKQQTQQNFEKRIGVDFRQKSHETIAYLTNFKTHTFSDKTSSNQVSGLLCYFIDSQGDCFKALFKYNPYFYIGFREDYEDEVKAFISGKYQKVIKTQTVLKVDLQELNHLSGKQKKYLKLYFHNLTDMSIVRKGIKKDTQRPTKNNLAKTEDLYTSLTQTDKQHSLQTYEIITTMRQYDIPFHSRVCIDTGLRAGKWFQISLYQSQITQLKIRDDILSRPDLRIMAYDIETSKAPLKFPDAEKDCIMMISLMFDGEAYLIVNLGFCGQAVDSFYYSPKKQYECNTSIFNEVDERALLERFFALIRDYKPAVVTSFNGDKFDFPFVHERTKRNDLNFEQLSGFSLEEKGQYYGRYISHLDCFYWVERDAYLPQGSHGLKAVTRQKLNYEPIQVEPQQMVRMAKQDTRSLAQYSISDAVATFYLYMKHIHDFIFALCTILPMTPDEVLRKGSGTLCENLLMTQAFQRRIIFPNKKLEEFLKVVDGKILDSETYTGGKVECLRTGVYRADFQTQFHLNPQAIQTDLIDKLDEVLLHAAHSMKKTKADISNYDEVKQKILQKLYYLRDVPNPTKHLEYPLIYHVDVAAMYPNIILTNRLQPVAVVNDSICGSCMWNNDQYDCKRELKWEWKGEFFPLNEAEMLGVQEVLDNQVKKKDKEEQVEYKQSGQYQKELKKRIRQYSQKTYKRMHVSKAQIKTDTVCMLQNSFYVDTVKAFRDRRYDFKAMVKKHKAIAAEQKKKGNLKEVKEATEMMAFYQSLQLAHKIILNSYYGYVMRKGARWYSMEMAAMVTHIGGNIIGDCKNLIEKRFGKPLELDTDGIWLLLPKNFPENQTFKFVKGGQSNFSYPCMLLNKFIYNKYKNPQYYRLTNQKKLQYGKQQEMSIEFEIDGPYKAMFIPSAKQKQKTEQIDIHQHNTQLLKKRYVVFDFNNRIHEFKGFEIKRRGQLQLIKVLQDQIFDQYLEGTNLQECYEACAKSAFKWLNILLKRGEGLSEDKLMGYVEESKVLSRDLAEYGNQKGVAVTSAKRLSEFLGPQMTKGKGLCCYYIISAKPVGKPVTDRAIPTSIFQASEAIKRAYIGKWTGQHLKGEINLKDILDWDYYKDRLETMIQKMICIPAITQGLDNPLPMVKLPDWLSKKHYEERQFTQQKMLNYFQVKPKQNIMEIFKSVRKDRTRDQDLVQMMPSYQRSAAKINYEHKQKIQKVNPYSMKSNFSKWLEVQKQIWTKGSEQVNVSSIKSSWHILQIVTKKSPGSYLIWYYSNGKINSAPLMIDRRYYISNPKGQKKAYHGEGNAIGIQSTEINFIKQNQFYNTLVDQNIYESRVPLEVSLIINKGAVLKVSSNKHSYSSQDFSEQFNEIYLPHIENNFMSHVFLIEIVVLENKHTWLIYNPKLKQYIFLFVGKNARNENFQKTARSLIEQSDISIQSHSFQNHLQSYNFMEKYFKQFKQDSKSPFLVITQTQTDPEHLQSTGVRMLYNELPVLKLPKITIQYENITILDWQHKTIKVVLQVLKSTNDSIVKVLGMSRYCFAPVCNLSQSPSIQDYATNIIYSRMLRAGGNILWWNQFNTKIQPIFQPQYYTGKVSNQGLYTEYCVELDMVNLGLISLVMNQDNEVKAAGMNMNKKNKISVQSGHLDEMAKVQVAVNYLKEMIKAWIKDAHLGIKQGDDLAENFPKWILTKDNPMYDPLIHRRLKHTMKKVIYDILLKLKDLGARIVYSDFEKIIINTKKRTFNEAINNVKFLISKLHEQSKIYKNIPLNPIKVWNILLFRGPQNYSGFQVTNKDEQWEYLQKWSIGYCFCPKIKEIFSRVLQHYISSVNEIVKRIIEEGEEDYVNFVMNYEQMVIKEHKHFISNQFRTGLLDVINYLFQQHQEWKQMKRDRQAAIEQGRSQIIQEQDHSHSGSYQEQDQDDENDSFIDDNEQLEDIIFNHQIKKGKKKVIDIAEWKDKNQIDILIVNVFHQLRDNRYEDQLLLVRRECLNLLEKLQGTCLRAPKQIQPVYPSFDIPCDNCYRINELPGNCMCGQKLKNEEFMERDVWRMMTERGGEMYCNTCKRLQDDFIRSSCKCGGRWVFHDNPLKWVKYTDRSGSEWNYVNEVLKFVGITNA